MKYVCALAAASLFSVSASAALVTFDLEYSGANLGNAATATGSITFDDTVLPNAPVSLFDTTGASLGITDFTITVAGASAGNGTFDLADLNNGTGGWVWFLTGPIDLTTELLGQANFADFNWLCNLNSTPCADPLAPQGVGVFSIETAGLELLDLVSMRPAPVPLPAAVWLLGSALLSLGWTGRKKAA